MGSNARLLELVKERSIREARVSFLAYRRLINPKDKWGWWQTEIASELEVFFDKFINGDRPKLVIQAPPQHGKSVQVIDFISWISGKNPDLRTIYTSFSERLGVRANLRLQRLYDSDIYKLVFPDTKINASNAVSVSGQFLRNREIVEYVGSSGYFRNTTVRGSITGESLDLGVIDDPIRGRADAGSITVRNAVWDWFTDDFFTRFSEHAALLAILTRWHLDDPIGRLIERYKDVKVLTYPAIAIKADKNRAVGDALFPEIKSIDFLAERKSIMDASSWESLYQQSPIVIGGELIRGEWFKQYNVVPPLKYRVMYADTAQKTAERNDYSVVQCWGLGEDGRIYLLDLIRGKWEAPELKRRVSAFWVKHKAWDEQPHSPALRRLKVEDKASGTGLIQDLRREASIPVDAIQRNTDKLTRVMDVVSYIESGYVYIPENAPWVSDFVSECESFTADDTHAHDDSVDCLADAISDLLAKRKSIYENI